MLSQELINRAIHLEQELVALKAKLKPINWTYGLTLILNAEVMLLANFIGSHNQSHQVLFNTFIGSAFVVNELRNTLFLGHVKSPNSWTGTEEAYKKHLDEIDAQIKYCEGRLPIYRNSMYYIAGVMVPCFLFFNNSHLNNPVTYHHVTNFCQSFFGKSKAEEPTVNPRFNPNTHSPRA